MDITWLGHACIRIRARTAAVVMDPAAKSAGFDMGRPTADIVTISHHHAAHDNVAGVRGKPLVIDGPGEYEIQGVQLFGIDMTMSGNDTDAAPQRNTTYLLEAEGVRVAHLGGVATAPTTDEAELLSNVDVLVIPLEGGYSVDPEEAARTVRALEPKIAIPVAYVDATAGGGSLRTFLDAVGLDVEEPAPKLSIQRRSIGDTQRVVLLEPSRQ